MFIFYVRVHYFAAGQAKMDLQKLLIKQGAGQSGSKKSRRTISETLGVGKTERATSLSDYKGGTSLAN